MAGTLVITPRSPDHPVLSPWPCGILNQQHNTPAQAMAHNAPYERACDRRAACVPSVVSDAARLFDTPFTPGAHTAALKAELDA